TWSESLGFWNGNPEPDAAQAEDGAPRGATSRAANASSTPFRHPACHRAHPRATSLTTIPPYLLSPWPNRTNPAVEAIRQPATPCDRGGSDFKHGPAIGIRQDLRSSSPS